MLLKKILAFLMGYVTLRIKGKYLEKFLNLALVNNMHFFNVRTLSEEVLELNLLLKDFWYIRDIAQKSGCRIHIKAKQGLPFYFNSIKKRKMLVTGFVVFVVIIYSMSLFIWQVEIKSYEELRNLKEKEILKKASELGLEKGALKLNINRHEIEMKLARDIERLSWVAIEFEGTKAIIKVAERVLPSPDQLARDPAHVIAAKDGIIKEVLVLAGEQAIQEGDTVHRGQILISGLVYPESSDEEDVMMPRKVRARGIVKAAVWYQKTYDVRLLQTGRKQTGEYAESVKLIFGENSYLLKGSEEPPFKYCEEETIEKTFTLPRGTTIGIVRTRYYEIEQAGRRMDEEQAKDVVLSKMLHVVRANMPKGGRITDQKIEILSKNKENMRIKVTVQTLEDICQVLPLDNMTEKSD